MQKLTTSLPVSLEDAYALQALPLRWESEIGIYTVTGIFYSEYGGYELTLAEPLPPDHEPDTYVATVGDDVALFHTAESYWWSLTDAERQRLEQVIDHIVFQKLHGSREAVIDLINTARRLGYDLDPLVAAILWILSEKVDEL